MTLQQALSTPNNDLLLLLAERAAALQDALTEMRRFYHRNPELGWREVETTHSIVSDLAQQGYQVLSGRELLGDAPRLGLSNSPVLGEGDTGCLAVFDTGRPGPTVCLRVDIDALPIEEAETRHRPAAGGWESRVKGVMHACGHDGHIAIGLGTARLVRPILENGRGKLKLLFQPAEEGGRGAYSIVNAGLMDDVDLFLAIHLGLGVPSNTAAFAVDGFLATRKYRVELTGRAAHAGKEPESGRNALLAACQIVPGLHALAQSSEPGIRVNVGKLEAGTAMNIVPQHARFEFEIRAASDSALEELDRRCGILIESIARGHEVDSEIELRGTADAWRNPADLVKWAEGVNRAVGAFSDSLPSHSFGASEDATLLAKAVASHGGKAAIFVLGADLEDKHHTPHFDFDESVLFRGSMLMAALIASALGISTAGTNA